MTVVRLQQRCTFPLGECLSSCAGHRHSSRQPFRPGVLEEHGWLGQRSRQVGRRFRWNRPCPCSIPPRSMGVAHPLESRSLLYMIPVARPCLMGGLNCSWVRERCVDEHLARRRGRGRSAAVARSLCDRASAKRGRVGPPKGRRRNQPRTKADRQQAEEKPSGGCRASRDSQNRPARPTGVQRLLQETVLRSSEAVDSEFPKQKRALGNCLAGVAAVSVAKRVVASSRGLRQTRLTRTWRARRRARRQHPSRDLESAASVQRSPSRHPGRYSIVSSRLPQPGILPRASCTHPTRRL